MELLVTVIVIMVIWYAVEAVLYRQTDYYKNTHKSYLSVRMDKGSYGEYLTYKYLKCYEEDGAKFLYNCYLPKENEKTTEIDVLMIHSSGIYVFESKNYSGWIFGSEKQKTWTQTLPNGKKSQKEHFLNPIMQNKLHIKWLKEQIGENYPIHSVIVFSERCTLKKIDLISTDIKVIKRDQVKHTVKEAASNFGNVMSQEQIVSVYDKLYPFTQVTDYVKEKHVEDIKTAHSEQVTVSVPDDHENGNLICPRCGSTLVTRIAKRGENAGKQFYGCSNFPKCRYIRDMD